MHYFFSRVPTKPNERKHGEKRDANRLQTGNMVLKPVSSRPRVARGNQKNLIIGKDKRSIDAGKDLSSKIVKVK